MRPTEESLRRIGEIDARIIELESETATLQSERAGLVDQALTYCETLEIHGFTSGALKVKLLPGKKVVNWRKEYERLATREASRRVRNNAPRVPVIAISEVRHERR